MDIRWVLLASHLRCNYLIDDHQQHMVLLHKHCLYRDGHLLDHHHPYHSPCFRCAARAGALPTSLTSFMRPPCQASSCTKVGLGSQPAILGSGCRAVHDNLPVASLQLECPQLQSRVHSTSLVNCPGGDDTTTCHWIRFNNALSAVDLVFCRDLSLSLVCAACFSLLSGRAESCDELFLCDEQNGNALRS